MGFSNSFPQPLQLVMTPLIIISSNWHVPVSFQKWHFLLALTLLQMLKLATSTGYSGKIMVSHYRSVAGKEKLFHSEYCLSSVLLRSTSVKPFNHSYLAAQLFQCMISDNHLVSLGKHIFVYTHIVTFNVTFFALTLPWNEFWPCWQKHWVRVVSFTF